MASAGPTSNQASPPHRPVIQTPASPPNKRDLKSWWKGFKLPSKHQDAPEARAPGIFGIPLRQSITYANVAISLIDEHGQSYIYGYVPIVVAKCGVFLKEKATGIEGIFRLSGSEKRIKELKLVFDSPDRYGKGLVWEGYTVHDAANVLRRYLNDLPEPVVPLSLYEKFRDPLRGATKLAVGDAEGPQFIENFNEMAAIERYQMLITELPPLNRQLLLYILDLLAVFAAKSDENRMNSQNLAAIFQPGMLSHPDHAMAPEEYRLNQCVIIFLIENQDHFLIGMQGTAADEQTMKDVQSGNPKGPVTPNPERKSGLGRSASNASAGAESVRRHGQIRRNRSIASKHSRNDGSSTPNSPALVTTPTGGLGRSNTVPSKKSPAVAAGKFKKQDSPGHQSPINLEPLTPARPVEELMGSDKPSAAPATVSSPSTPPRAAGTSSRVQERLLEVPQDGSNLPKDRNLQNKFQRTGTDGSDKRQPNKLKKKRIPGALNHSAQSSNASLPQSHSNAPSPNAEITNPMEQMQPRTQPTSQPTSQPMPPPPSNLSTQLAPQPAKPSTPQAPALSTEPEKKPEQVPTTPPQRSNPPLELAAASPQAAPPQVASDNTLHPENATRGKKSPPTSLHSSFNEGSDMDQVGEGYPVPQVDSAEKEKKRRWRLSSRARRDDNGSAGSPPTTPPQVTIGSNDNAEVSMTSIGSALNRPRKSFTGGSSENLHESHDGSRDDKDDSKGPIGWIRNKYREAKESAEQRRNKSPPPDQQGLGTTFHSRGKSFDIKRDQPEGEKPTQLPLQGEAPTGAAKENPAETTKEDPKAAFKEDLKEAPKDTPKEAQTEILNEPAKETTAAPEPQVAPEPQIQPQVTEIQPQQPEILEPPKTQ